MLFVYVALWACLLYMFGALMWLGVLGVSVVFLAWWLTEDG